MSLILAHPEVARVSCADCQAWAYNDDWTRTKRLGRDVPRPPGSPTPCGTCPKIPASAPERTPEHAIELTTQNWQAYRHYLECRAVGQFPDDPIVRRTARVVRGVYDEIDRSNVERILSRLNG